MRNPTGAATPSPSETKPRPGASSRALGRFLGHPRSTGRRRPQSIELDAKLQVTHVRPAPLRPDLY